MEPPGPVPNPEVKHFSADGSWAIGPVRVGRRQFICPLQANACSGLFLCPDDLASSRWQGKEGRGKNCRALELDMCTNLVETANYDLSLSLT